MNSVEFTDLEKIQNNLPKYDRQAIIPMFVTNWVVHPGNGIILDGRTALRGTYENESQALQGMKFAPAKTFSHISCPNGSPASRCLKNWDFENPCLNCQNRFG